MSTITQKISENKLISFLILAVFFALPFERIPTIEISDYTVKISYILCIIFIAITLFSGNLTKIFKENPLTTSDKVLVLFWLSGLVSLFWAPDLKRGIIIFILWTFVMSLYLIFSRILTDIKIRNKAENVIILASVLVCLFGLFQFLGDSFGFPVNWTGLRDAYTKSILGFPRIQSVMLEPLYFANFLMVPIFLAIKKYLLRDKIINLYFFIIVLLLINIILSISRGAYLSIGVALLLMTLYLIVNRKVSGYKLKLLGLVAAFAMSLMISLAMISLVNGQSAQENFVDHAFVENVESDGSAYDRIGTYKQAIDLFKKNFILGNGVGSFGIIATPEEKKIQGIYQTVNNEYLEILTETGVIGLFLFLAFLVLYLFEIFKGFRKREFVSQLSIITLFFGLLTIFIQYNFFSTLYIIYIWVFLALLKGEANIEEV